VQYVVLAGITLGLTIFLVVEAGKRVIGYHMPKTADRVDAWREESFIRRTAQAIVDGEGYTAWEIERYVARRTPQAAAAPHRLWRDGRPPRNARVRAQRGRRPARAHHRGNQRPNEGGACQSWRVSRS